MGENGQKMQKLHENFTKKMDFEPGPNQLFWAKIRQILVFLSKILDLPEKIGFWADLCLKTASLYARDQEIQIVAFAHRILRDLHVWGIFSQARNSKISIYRPAGYAVSDFVQIIDPYK